MCRRSDWKPLEWKTPLCCIRFVINLLIPSKVSFSCPWNLSLNHWIMPLALLLKDLVLIDVNTLVELKRKVLLLLFLQYFCLLFFWAPALCSLNRVSFDLLSALLRIGHTRKTGAHNKVTNGSTGTVSSRSQQQLRSSWWKRKKVSVCYRKARNSGGQRTSPGCFFILQFTLNPDSSARMKVCLKEWWHKFCRQVYSNDHRLKPSSGHEIST